MKTLDQVKEWAALDWDSYFAALKVRTSHSNGAARARVILR
jgi:hypothetical protein